MNSSKDYYNDYWAEGRHGGLIQGYYPYLLRWLNRELPSDQTYGTLLEAGCGAAAFTPHLAKRATVMKACDISAKQIKKNSETFEHIHFFTQDLGVPLACETNSIDAIWCSEVLEHLFNPAFALSEFYRVLKPGGKLLITVPYHGGLKNLLIALFKWDEHFSPDNPHIRFFTKNTISRVVSSAGFRTIRMETCGMGKLIRDCFVPTNLLLTAVKEPL
jgi:SAM-dependent methyltransferase